MTKRLGRLALVAAALGTLPLTAFADEIVHFTNGAEMTVRAHTVEKEKEMVRLDLGGNSFIAFPMAMVDKIVSAGRDVFLNPVFHPSNQAIAGAAGSVVADTSVRGAGDPAGFVHRPNSKAGAGTMLGEAADQAPATSISGQPIEMPMALSRKVYNPAFPPAPGSPPQVIMPPSKTRTPAQLTMLPTRPPDPPVSPPPAAAEPPETQPAGDPAPEDPPDTP